MPYWIVPVNHMTSSPMVTFTQPVFIILSLIILSYIHTIQLGIHCHELKTFLIHVFWNRRIPCVKRNLIRNQWTAFIFQLRATQNCPHHQIQKLPRVLTNRIS